MSAKCRGSFEPHRLADPEMGRADPAVYSHLGNQVSSQLRIKIPDLLAVQNLWMSKVHVTIGTNETPTKLTLARRRPRLSSPLMHHQSFFGSATSALLRASRRSDWVCIECRRSLKRPAQRRAASNTSTNLQKPFYVTTPIFYVNAAPHVGHLYSMVLADVIKRHAELRGEKAILLTGTDEHGMKIQRAAEKANSDPKSFCDKGAETFKVNSPLSLG
jgi:hypothetical protein